MPPRLAINCGDWVAFVVTYNRTSPSALRYPLWLKPPANANERAVGTSRLRLIETTVQAAAV